MTYTLKQQYLRSKEEVTKWLGGTQQDEADLKGYVGILLSTACYMEGQIEVYEECLDSVNKSDYVVSKRL